MNSPIRVVLAAAGLAAALALSAPAFADGHGHGGGNSGGGFAGGRGGYSMSHGAGPGGGRPAAAYGRSGGFSGGHVGGGPGFSGGHFNGAPAARFGNSPARVYSSPRFTAAAPGVRSAGGRNFSGRTGFYRPTHGIGVGARPHSWGGGYFRGSYWPRSYYHSGFVRFFPVLPAFYSTFWFSGVPYYYWDDAYYTWSPSEYGYVATDPPPVVDTTAASDDGSAQVQSSGSSSLYVYPRNGQSEEQTATDRFECHQWAVGQTGFDPTGASQSQTANGPADYQRAITACLDARGYSAR